MFLLVVLFFPSLFSDGQQEKHFLHYKFTALPKADTFPEFSAVCVYDDRQIVHYNAKDRLWVRESLTVDSTKSPSNPPVSREWFIRQLHTLSNCSNSLCSELHVLQRIIGCELEKLPDGSVNLTVFDDYGFDGEDFISFNYDTGQWIDKSPKAKETKDNWNRHTGRNQFLEYYLKTCSDWISTFHSTKKSSPDVRVSVSKSADDESKVVLVCLATGFYPRDVQMNIRLNRINLENQTSSGIRPNADETFQMRISVKIDRNHEGSYDCLFIQSSLTEPVTVKWDGKCIDCKMPRRHIITGVIVVVGILPFFCWIIYQLKRVYGRINSDDVDDVDDDDDDSIASHTAVIRGKPVKRSPRNRRGLKC
ncbi:zinc-alpha-2-glycoprotein-like [Siphateles boraxobius]|uniref:zinc-alpha-2-glycoprotein-like n=1 Tax=Siphateles boraxobius TaxID=180520 RepID=UPI0040645811